MKFIKYLFTGWFALWTLIFNVGLGAVTYTLIFVPMNTYEGMTGVGLALVAIVWGFYWTYVIKGFKEKTKA